MRLSGKTAFITGGTRGIGLATVEAFIEHGAMVGFTARKTEGVNAVIARLAKNCVGFVADAGDDEAMVAALSATSSASGGIDVVFANAGHYVNAPLGETSRETLQQQLSVVTNTFMTVQLALPHLREGASIILMGSLYASMGPPGAGAYAASKAGIAALARSFASELSPRGIRVNVVVPGAVDTPSWGMDDLELSLRDERKRLIGERAPLNRMIRAAEVANAVLFLASDESSGLQATEIVVDGGTTGAMAGSPRYVRGEP
ncbi:SDR family NAD(P)-dependent oxidoreductase [Rhodobacter sp. SY28-1]|uniref:SDR family NAD(P)-dependent oxidoreductase n=1 Tax=Rhodobacter sp. SY28-1 TaxID=2562317 RepID=UPI0010BFC37C|nr:SDR family NAD(P)-dependent oxidoreductase [Rhodobacter sp. SY28-1]